MGECAWGYIGSLPWAYQSSEVWSNVKGCRDCCEGGASWLPKRDIKIEEKIGSLMSTATCKTRLTELHRWESSFQCQSCSLAKGTSTSRLVRIWFIATGGGCQLPFDKAPVEEENELEALRGSHTYFLFGSAIDANCSWRETFWEFMAQTNQKRADLQYESNVLQVRLATYDSRIVPCCKSLSVPHEHLEAEIRALNLHTCVWSWTPPTALSRFWGWSRPL